MTHFCEMLWVNLHLLWLLQNCLTALHIRDSQRKQQEEGGGWTWFHREMTCEKGAHKFHSDDL